MSQWSSCNAIIGLTINSRDVPNFEILVKSALELAPKITGSERNADIQVLYNPHNTSTNFPCNRCPIRGDVEHLVLGKDAVCPGYDAIEIVDELKKVPCQTREEYNLIGRYVTSCRIIITTPFGLRDRDAERTKNEFKAFVDHLKNIFNKSFDIKVITKSIK